MRGIRPQDVAEGLRLAGNYIALAGEFFVLGQLALRGLDGTLTLGHTKEIDILVLNRETGRTFRVEVKTTTKDMRRSGIFGTGYAWLMDEQHGHVTADDLVYCFVTLDTDAGKSRFFLAPSRDVAGYIRWEYRYWKRHAPRRTGKLSPMRMFRVPQEAITTRQLPPSWRDGRWRRFENNWAIFGARQ